MQVVQDNITIINDNNGFTLHEYQNSQLLRFDLSHINDRKVYVDLMPESCRWYNTETRAFIEIQQVDGVQLHCTMLMATIDRAKAIIQSLMTSTTPFGVSWLGVILYSRLRIWHFSYYNQRVQSYRPIVDDVNKPIQVKVSNFAAAMHQNGNVCYVRTFQLFESLVYALRLSTDCQIVDVYLDQTVLHVLVKKDDLACFGCIGLSTIARMRIDWGFYKWSDSLHVCNFILYNQNQRANAVRSGHHIDYTFECLE